jgi:hypothetical protein
MYILKLWLVSRKSANLKIEAKREKAFNLSHVGLGPKAISGTLNMPISTVYWVIKAGTIKRKTSTSPGNNKATQEFLLRLKRTVEIKPTKSIRSMAKKLDVHERMIRRSLKLLGKKAVVHLPRLLLTEHQKEVQLESRKRLLNHQNVCHYRQ